MPLTLLDELPHPLAPFQSSAPRSTFYATKGHAMTGPVPDAPFGTFSPKIATVAGHAKAPGVLHAQRRSLIGRNEQTTPNRQIRRGPRGVDPLVALTLCVDAAVIRSGPMTAAHRSSASWTQEQAVAPAAPTRLTNGPFVPWQAMLAGDLEPKNPQQSLRGGLTPSATPVAEGPDPDSLARADHARNPDPEERRPQAWRTSPPACCRPARLVELCTAWPRSLPSARVLQAASMRTPSDLCRRHRQQLSRNHSHRHDLD